MKRLLCGTLTALFVSLPLYANSPDASTSTTTETMRNESMTPSGNVQKEEESTHRSHGSSMSPSDSHQDAQMQQAPASSDESMKKESTTTTTEEVED